MIKKYLLWLFSLLLIPSFSSAYDIPWIWAFQDSVFVISENYDITTTYWWIDTFNWFYTEYSFWWANVDRYWFGWLDDKLYMVSFSHNWRNDRARQWFFDWYCRSDLNASCSSFNLPISEFYDAMWAGFSSFSVSRWSSYWDVLIFCFSNDSYNYCLGLSPRTDYPASPTSWDLNFDISYLSYEKFKQISWWNSPFISSSSVVLPDYWYSVNMNTDLDKYIRYYETRFNWDENICYVWTNDVTTLYPSENMSFILWSWNSIFWLYYNMYNTYWDNIIVNVWRFINTWLINYREQYFDRSWMIAYYDWPWTKVRIWYDYTWNYFDWFPFAIYWMTTFLYNYYNVDNRVYNTQSDWLDVSYYCYLKLNYDRLKENETDFKDIENMFPDEDKEVVKDYYNRNIWNKENEGGFSVPDLNWTWSWADVSSWHVLPDDLSPVNLFKDFFSRITWTIDKFNPNNDNPLVPVWITRPLLFLVLFRIFKH